MFESETKLRAFCKNVTDRLEPGGFFIGSTVDPDELVFRIRQSEDNSIANEFFRVVLPQDHFSKSESPYGHKYFFYLKEAIGKENFEDDRPKMVDEFLMNFKELVRVMRDFGMVLVMKKNFRQYFDDMTAEVPQSLLNGYEPTPGVNKGFKHLDF